MVLFQHQFEEGQDKPVQYRSEAEDALFGEGLQSSNIWYGHMHTPVWMQPTLPDGFSFPAHLAATYEDSGWCFIEAAISALLKPRVLRLDLSKRPEVPLYPMIADQCVAGRMPPLLPSEVRRLLRDVKKFTAPADIDRVGSIYERFFTAAAPLPERLDLSGLRWGDTEAQQLSLVAPFFVRCHTIDLSSNNLASGAAANISKIVESTPALKELKCAIISRSVQCLPLPLDLSDCLLCALPAASRATRLAQRGQSTLLLALYRHGSSSCSKRRRHA